MIILIRQIPKDSSIYELFDFVRPAVKSWLFPEKPLIQKVEILRLHDVNQDHYEFHGLVHVDSAKAAKRAIKKLDGQLFLNEKVAVREYFPRNEQKMDRRNPIGQMLGFKDNRRENRRRDGSQLVVTVYKVLTRRMRLLL